MSNVRFVATETGIRLLRSTYRSFAASGSTGVRRVGRISQTVLGSSDPRDLVVHSGFLRLVSITEAAVDALAVELTAQSVPQIDEVVRRLMLEKELSATGTWRARRSAYKRHHNIDLGKCAEFKRLEGAIEVRNAIAHGLGKLTTRQVHSRETAPKLGQINVNVVNGFVALGPNHVEECASYCREFLLSLDASA